MNYDPIAEEFDRHVRGEPIMHELSINAILSMAPRGGRVLDAGCGQGVLTRSLAAHGYEVVGVDISRKLLDIARSQEEGERRGIEYIEDDASSLNRIADESFDGVASNLAITDIDDLAGLARSVCRVLKPGGWFVFAFPHPCFYAPRARWTLREGEKGKLITSYFEEGRWWPAERQNFLDTVGAQHRTLSTIFNTLLEAGLAIDRLAEPQASYVPLAEILVVRALKPAA